MGGLKDIHMDNKTTHDETTNTRDWLWSQFEQWKIDFREEIRNEVKREVEREVHSYFWHTGGTSTTTSNNHNNRNIRGAADIGGGVAADLHLVTNKDNDDDGSKRGEENERGPAPTTNFNSSQSFEAVKRMNTEDEIIGRAGLETPPGGIDLVGANLNHVGDIEQQQPPPDEMNKVLLPAGSKSRMSGILATEDYTTTLATKQASRDSSSPFDILHDMQKEIRILQDQICGIKIAEENLSPSPSPQNPIPRRISRRFNNLLFSKTAKYPGGMMMMVNDDEKENDDLHDPSSGEINSLEDDTFALMMISKPYSQAWALGLFVFSLQAILGVMIIEHQLTQAEGSSYLNIPFMANRVVRIGQFLTIILCLTAQSDVLTSIQTFLILGSGSNWDVVIGEKGNRSRGLWMTRIMIPITLKLLQGIIVILTCYVIILQSDDIIDLLKDFTALMVLSDTDNLFFDLAAYGYLGRHLKAKTVEARNAEIESVRGNDNGTGGGGNVAVPSNANMEAMATETGDSTTPTTSFLIKKRELKKRAFNIRFFGVILILLPLFGLWVATVIKQQDGTFFRQMYPNCDAPDDFMLAKKHFGNGICYGGHLNTLGCGFEGGDCVNFNLAYPLCKRDDLTNVEEKVGDGDCHLEFAIDECAYDGYDCCAFEIASSSSFGDGLCHGGILATKGCAYDGGDCEDFHELYPNCDVENLSKEEGSSEVILGDGICQGGVYDTEPCGFEFGDCDKGQVGQDIPVDKVYSAHSMHARLTDDRFFFNIKMSLDGSTLLVGEFYSEGSQITSPGTATVYGFNSKKQMWMSMGSNLVGGQESEAFGISLAMNSDGSRIAIGGPGNDDGGAWLDNTGCVRTFDFNERNNTWVTVGQKIKGELGSLLGFAIDMSSDGSRLAIAAPFLNQEARSGEISVWDFHHSQHRWARVGQKIHGQNDEENIGSKYLYLSSTDGSRMIFNTFHNDDALATTRVYEYDNSTQVWFQTGVDIPSPLAGTGKTARINGDGNRIVVSAYAGDPDTPGQVQVLDFNAVENSWDQVGDTLFEPSIRRRDVHTSQMKSVNANGFGRSLAMSSDGNFLAISSIDPDCDGLPAICATGSVLLFVYDPARHRFNIIPNKSSPIATTGAIQARPRNRESSIFGLHLSLNSDASLISISGYNMDTDKAFINVYDVNELFYPRCMVYQPFLINDGVCDPVEPYATEPCGYDGGDCSKPSPVEEYPGCFVSIPPLVGDGMCIPFVPYNTEECGFDGGDCLEPSPVDDYPGCIVMDPEQLGDGVCNSYLPYNSVECNFDGGDCL